MAGQSFWCRWPIRFRRLHSGKHNEEVQLCALGILAGDGNDMRQLPLSMRKANLARLLAGHTEGIFIAPFELMVRQRLACSSRNGTHFHSTIAMREWRGKASPIRWSRTFG